MFGRSLLGRQLLIDEEAYALKQGVDRKVEATQEDHMIEPGCVESGVGVMSSR